MEIYLAETQGFCAGVALAIGIVNKALKKYGAPLYVYHEIVHNTHVVEGFRREGVIFVENINDVPECARLIFSAHGVSPSVIETAKARKLKVVDATCPLVTKVHKEAQRFSRLNCETILIGHKGHQELIGTAGCIDADLLHIIEDEKDIEALKIEPNAKVAYITQTTLSIDDTAIMIERLKKKFKNLVAPSRSDLCYATQNRQNAVKELAKVCDIIIICGSPNSSNSNRLRETGEKYWIPSYIVDSADELDVKLFKGKNKVGISSGASVPRIIVDQLVDKIKQHFPGTVVHIFENPEKNIVFALPKF
ncbi:MAG: 4-hydroxy-3-methylbut-2-enyl diphosphate reductase [Candidatus Omnitrophica bacterium]|nr:4-hydroxy-3-methylbut-2-enyl diphosphate reductase [Candidatus Omnitrophota bacterium]